MFDADRNHQMMPRNAEGTPVRALFLEMLERRLLLSGDTVLGGADPNLNLVPESAPEMIVAGVNMPTADAGIQGSSEVLAAPGPMQVIVPDPVTQSVLPESAFSLTVTYSTDPADEMLTGLGLRLHYNSSLLRWDSFSGVFGTSKIAEDSSPLNDAANYDGDSFTDKYLQIAWADLSGNWPGGGGMPLDLYVANFIALPAFASGSTTIHFSASSTPAGSTLDATSATITLENQAPTDIALSHAGVAENQPVNTVVGSFSTMDPDTGNTFTYSLVSGTGSTDNGLFAIVGNQLQTAAVFNYEVKNSYSIRVRSTDQGGLSTEKVFNTAVTDVNEAPTVALANKTSSLPEDTSTASRLKVADIEVTDDALGTNVLSLEGADVALFEIVGPELCLKAGTVLNHETHPFLTVLVAVDDITLGAGVEDTEPLTIEITDVNQPPTDITLSGTSVAENQPADTPAGAFSATDPDTGEEFTYGFASGEGDTDNSLFAISGNELRTAAVFNYEVKNNYSIRVRSMDRGGLYTEKVFSIAVTDVNEAPTAALANTTASLPENTSTTSPLKVADIVVTDDALGTNVLSLSGTDAALFEIVGTGLYLQEGAVLDYETNPVLDVTVAVDDPSLGDTPDGTASLRIDITDINEAPTVALINTITSLPEDTDGSSAIKVADIEVTDDALGAYVLSLEGADVALFEIVGTALYLKAGVTLSDQINPALDVTVAVDDAGVGGTTAALSIQVTHVISWPTALGDTAATDEDTATTLSATSLLANDSDPESGHVLSIVGLDTAGTRGLVTDNGDGTYTYNPNGQFQYLAVGESATDSFLYTVSDGYGGTDTATVTITVTGASDLRIDRYSVRSGRILANNCIKMSGYFDIPESELAAGDRIHVQIFASDDFKLFDGEITIGAADLRQGVYTYRTSLPKGSSGAVTLLKLDARRHAFDLCVEGLDLSRLSYPLTLKLTVGDYFGSAQTN